MLAWLTFVAAALAAVGSILAPLVAGRSETARRQQEEIDRYVEFAVSDDATVRAMGRTHLEYLVRSGRLTAAQADAAAAALTATLGRTDHLVRQHPHAAITAVPSPTASSRALTGRGTMRFLASRRRARMAEIIEVSTADVERAQLVIKLNDYQGKPTSDSIRRIAAATRSPDGTKPHTS